MTVTLRRAEAGDADFLLALLADDDTRPFLGRVPQTREQVLADLERSRAEPRAYGWLVVEVDGERAGSVVFERVSERNRIAEVGRFAIQPRFRGRGIGDEAARAVQRLLLRELGFHRLELRVWEFNERALAHAERVGYVREGIRRRAYLKDGTWVGAICFSLLQEELDG